MDVEASIPGETLLGEIFALLGEKSIGKAGFFSVNQDVPKAAFLLKTLAFLSSLAPLLHSFHPPVFGFVPPSTSSILISDKPPRTHAP
jgi:hypothetical protein